MTVAEVVAACRIIEGTLRGAAQELSGMLLKVRCSLKGVVGACYDNSCRCCCIAHHVQQQQLGHAGYACLVVCSCFDMLLTRSVNPCWLTEPF